MLTCNSKLILSNCIICCERGVENEEGMSDSSCPGTMLLSEKKIHTVVSAYM